MTNIPKNLIEALVSILNDNLVMPIERDAMILHNVRDMLVEAGCIYRPNPYSYTVNRDYVGATGCVDCGRHGVHDDEGLCNDCRGPVDDIPDYDGYELCPGCGCYLLSPGDDLCPECLG
jgi:hypothetical protein